MASMTWFSLLSSNEADEEGKASKLAEGAPKPQKSAADKAARQKQLEKCFKEAHHKAAVQGAQPLCQGRLALLGLLVVAMIRGIAWWDGNIPGYSVFGMHFLTTTSDVACIAFALPFFVTGTAGQCVQVGCVGPMMTLIFAMAVVDIGALFAFLLVATPRPLSEGAHSFIDKAEASIGVWDLALLASVAFQVALLLSCWRVYKELRVNGLYPPGTLPAGMGGKIEEVSLLEVCCEADDVKCLNELDCMGGAAAKPQGAASKPSDAAKPDSAAGYDSAPQV